MFNSIKLWYQFSLWDKALVKASVAAAWITADQYKTIVGEEYQVPAASTTPTGMTSAASGSTAATSGTANVTPTA
jgi:hypothetical protein